MLVRALDMITILGLALVGGILVTGGGTLSTAHGRIEFSQLTAWVAAVILLTLVRTAAGGLTLERLLASPLFRALDRFRARAAEIRRPETALVRLLLGAVGLFTLIHCFRHWSYHTNIMDLGVIHHVLSNTQNFRPYACDVCPNGTFLSDHLAFALALAAPVASAHEAIFLFQSVLLAAALGLLIRLGPLREKPETWVLAFALVLCHPAVRGSWTGDFREDHLAFFFLCLASLGALRLNLPLLAIASVLALLCKENLALILPWLYLATWLAHRPHGPVGPGWTNRRAPAALVALTLLSGAWAFVSFHFLLPHFAGPTAGTHEMVARFPGLGGSPQEVIGTLLRRPWVGFGLLFGNLFKWTGIHYLLALFGPWLACVWFSGSAVWLIPAVPGILMNLISGAETQRSLQFHYELVILPFFLLAALGGLRRAKPWQLTLALLLALLFSGRWPGLQLRQNWPSSDDLGRVVWIFKEIPASGTIGASDAAAAQISLRPELRLFHIPGGELRATEPVAAWTEFMDANRSDRTGLPEHELILVDYLLLDHTRAAEARLADQPAAGWQVLSKSPDGKLVLMTRPRG